MLRDRRSFGALLTKWGLARIACEVAACAWRHVCGPGTRGPLGRSERFVRKLRGDDACGRDTLTGAHRNVIPGAQRKNDAPIS